MKKYLISLLLVLGSILTAIALAEDIQSNATDNTTSIANISDNNQSSLLNQTNITSNESIPSNETQLSITDYSLVNFIPREFKIGDVQLNIQVQNTGTTELKNIIALVSGKGFSSYDVTPIDSLKPGEKSYVLVAGNFREEGDITLLIKIMDKTFYQNVTVINPDSQQKIKEIQEAEERAKESIAAISAQLSDLNNKYAALESEFETKKKNKYDVSTVNLEDLKEFLRNTQSSLITGDVEEANASLTVALNEYADQKARLERAAVIKQSFLSKLKDQALLISTLLGAILASFTLYELLKKKKDSLYHKIKEVKIDNSTKITVEKKDEPKQKQEEEKKEIKEEIEETEKEQQK